MFQGYRVHIGSPERGSGHPRQLYGPNGPRGETQQPAWAAAPPCRPNLEGKERGERKEGEGFGLPLPSLPLLLPFPFGKYERGGSELEEAPSRIPPTWACPLLLPLPPTYIYMWGAPLEHVPTTVSRVRRSPPQFTPPVIFS